MARDLEHDIMDSAIVPWGQEKPAETALREIYALCAEQLSKRKFVPEYDRTLLKIQLRASEGMKHG